MFAAGALSLVSKTQNTANLSSAAASGGTSPYTYQWYRSTTSGFTPGGGNILAGKTALTLADTGLVPGTQYYYKVVATDTGNSNVTAESAQLGVQSAPPQPVPNQFAQAAQLGMIDQRLDYSTFPAQIDVSETGTLYAGAPVKLVDSAGGIPKVKLIEATTDLVFGYINYNQKNVSFIAGSPVELSLAGNVIYLYSVGAIGRGIRVVPSLITNGGVAAVSGSGAENIVGWAYDKASAAGELIRVYLLTPNFLYDGS